MSADLAHSPEFDIVIAGGGPAGMAAAIWCADLGLSCCLIEGSSSLGGQLGWIHAAITNYPGIVAENGADLLRRFESSLPNNIDRVYGSRVVSIDAAELAVTLDSGRTLTCRSIILATGIRRRRLGIQGEVEFLGKGILDSGSKAKSNVSGKRVVIIGGGDAAIENALILSESAAKVTVIHRRAGFSAREEFLEPATKRSNVELITSSELLSINGDDVVKTTTFRSNASDQSREIDADAVLIRVGVEPNSEFVEGIVDLDPRGYIVVDRNCMTSISNVFAIGDVSNPAAPTIAGAVGDAATAVKSAFSRLGPNS
ncbi:MAG TPA: NAD(P)/FAD-dependent oxidoreductase [Pyrinomonadaceae bacterium]|nr:NAD(P)/FAD-dependent oxidoreductase [Pyrinomonadaceae bacterium]